MAHHRFQQNGLVGKAHVHFADKLHELGLDVSLRYKVPAVFIRIGFHGVLSEIVEKPVFAYRNCQIRNYLALPDVPLHRFRLHIDHTDKLELRNHVLHLCLPVEQVYDLVIRRVDWRVKIGYRLFSGIGHVGVVLSQMFRCEDVLKRAVLRHIERSVQ